MRRRTAIALVERLSSRVAWYARRTGGRARLRLRDALTSAGARLQPERLVLDCASGAEASGLFSEVAAVVGCLAHYEARPELYAGLRVDFQEHGLYYDPAAGANWWEYYFEPVTIASSRKAIDRIVPPWQHDDFAEYVELDMPRDVAAGIVKRHVRIRESMRNQVDRYWVAHADGAGMIGIHYRGTDKWEGAPPVPYEAVAAAVREASVAVGDAHCKIFVATDEQAFLDYMLTAYPGQVVYRQMPRSVDGHPIHKAPGDGFRKGEDAVIDCLLLARCAQLVRTDSDLGLFATFFNPDLPVRLLGTPL
ncbi:MAG: nodulation protein NodZ [Acidobacteriota bacterium]|nr:nodulation protein NodZ [Acidobacteriota bacterium]